MKIAMALENFGRFAGGAESYAVELARTLVSEGWDVHLYGHSWDGEPAQAVFHEIPPLPRWIPPSLRILDFAFRHRRMVAQERFDVILGFGNTLEMTVYQSHGGVHYLSSVRKLQAVRNPLLRFLKRLALFAAPKYHARAWIESAPFRMSQPPVIVAIADMVRQDMADFFHVEKDRIRLVYNGIDETRFGSPNPARRSEVRRKLGFADDDVLFLFMAYDFRKKGVSYLVEAAGVLRERCGSDGWGVVVVGRPPSPALSRQVEGLGLGRRVVFPGSTKEPESFYQTCDVFVLPTFYDTCSLVVFEAMAAGLPAITTQFNGAAGIISHGIDGAVLIDPLNTDDIASAMERFMDRQFLHQASKAAREKASRYTLRANHRAMLEILTQAGGISRSTGTETRP
jgi:UDP-glucose:(heptosyl)LPS alpha-1,3-glucosyltransferase